MTRSIGAGILGIGAGIGAFIVVVLAGWLVYQRLWGESLIPLIVIGLVAIGTGLYAGWLVGMLVFSAVRGDDVSGAGDGSPEGEREHES